MIYLSILFWVFFATYVIHILDETILNGGFVKWIADNFWPTYHMRMFFWFNAAALALIALSNILFDSFGGHWVILPLIWITGFFVHAFTVHLYWTIRRNTYSPGLVSSTLYIVIFYITVKYGYGRGMFSTHDLIISATLGVITIGAFLTIGPTWLFPNLMRRHMNNGR